MKRTSLYVSFVAVVVLLGCEKSPPGAHPSQATVVSPLAGFSEEYAARLEQKARELAELELARMAAAEMIYRNKAVFQKSQVDLTGGFVAESGAYVKIYRNFKGYHIEDIYQSGSLKYPIAYEIHYDYDVLATTPRGNHLPNAEELAQQDHEYEILRQGTLVRRYRCDTDGNYEGGLPELPPRPDLFELDRELMPESGSALPNLFPAGGPPLGIGTPPPFIQTLPHSEVFPN